MTTAEACTDAWRVQPSSVPRDGPQLADAFLALDHVGQRRRLLVGVVQRDVEGKFGTSLAMRSTSV